MEKLQTDWPASVHVHIFKDSLNLSRVKTMNLRHCKYLAQVGEALYDNSDQEPIGYEARFLDEPAVMEFADMVTDAVGKEHRGAVREGMDGGDLTEGGKRGPYIQAGYMATREGEQHFDVMSRIHRSDRPPSAPYESGQVFGTTVEEAVTALSTKSVSYRVVKGAHDGVPVMIPKASHSDEENEIWIGIRQAIRRMVALQLGFMISKMAFFQHLMEPEMHWLREATTTGNRDSANNGEEAPVDGDNERTTMGEDHLPESKEDPELTEQRKPPDKLPKTLRKKRHSKKRRRALRLRRRQRRSSMQTLVSILWDIHTQRMRGKKADNAGTELAEQEVIDMATQLLEEDKEKVDTARKGVAMYREKHCTQLMPELRPALFPQVQWPHVMDSQKPLVAER